MNGHPPLGRLRSGQCLVQVSSGFLGWLSTAAANVWIHNLYIRGPVLGWFAPDTPRHTLLQWRPLPPAALWVTNTTLEGGLVGLSVQGASAYAEGEALVHGPSCRPRMPVCAYMGVCMQLC